MPEPGRVVVIGGSAGGLDGVVSIAGSLPPRLNAAVFVVLHSAAKGSRILPQILARSGPLPAAYAIDGQPIQTSRIYVAPPDLHMVLTLDTIRLSHGPKENGFRPAVDPLFRSAADCFEEHAIGVVLSGGLSDGAAGLRAIKRSGGYTIVQDPDEAPFQGMPSSALEMGPVDYTLPAGEIGNAIARIVRSGATPSRPPAEEDPPGIRIEPRPPPSSFTCPECHGILWELKGKSPQFRCRVGHSYSITRLLEAQNEGVERALWAAVRAMEESGSLARRLSEDAGRRNQAFAAKHFLRRAVEKETHATVVRQVLNAKPPSKAGRKAKAVAKRAR
jgi:two-component system chemotaxis response regulator CheB